MSLAEQVTPEVDKQVAKKGRWEWLPGWVRKLDRGIVALLIVFVLTLPLFTARIYASDEIKYFSYLHSIFFDHDVDFTDEYNHFYESDPKKYANFRDTVLNKRNEIGLPVNEGPVGSAVLWSPFYGVGHLAALAGNAVGLKSFKPDGYSTPYVWGVTLASLFYGFAGLIFAYLFCCNFLPRYWAAFATIVIWLATPVIFYLSLTPPMSHANSLFVLSLWLWLWYKTRGWRIDEKGNFIPGQRRGSMWLLLGVLGGLATMVREQDGTIMIIAAIESLYLYWQVWKRGQRSEVRGQELGSRTQEPGDLIENPKSKIQNLLPLFARNLLFLGGFILGVLPQLVIYQALNGHLGPSKVVGDKLQFFNPVVVVRLVGLLADPNHGLWWWSPVLLPALVGLVLMLREKRLRFLAVVMLAAFFCELYVSASFQTWTQQGSFGPRRLVGISVAYIAGLGYLTWWLAQGKRGWHLSRRWLNLLAVLFVAWNFGLIIQFSAIRTEADRQNLDPARVIRDQFTVVPGRLLDTAQKFIFNREKFYKK